MVNVVDPNDPNAQGTYGAKMLQQRPTMITDAGRGPDSTTNPRTGGLGKNNDQSMPPLELMMQPGFLDGYYKARADSRANQSQDNANQSQDNANASENRTQTTFLNEQQLQLGMRQASEQGGFDAVIDFLRTADPVKAVQFNRMKLELDDKMAESEVIQTALPAKKAAAMVEGYEVLGKMGMALLQANDDDRGNMYKQMLPIIKTVNPGASASLDQNAVDMFVLAAAQATPTNTLATSQKQMAMAKTEYGQTAMAMDELSRSGKKDSDLYRNLEMHSKALQSKDNEAFLQQTKAQMAINEQMGGDPEQNAKINQQYAKQLQSLSSAYLSSVEGFKTMTSNLQVIDQYGPSDSRSAIALVAMRRTMVKDLNKGPMTDKDVAELQGTAGLGTMSKKATAFLTGSNVPLNSSEVSQVAELYKTYMQTKQASQIQVENQFKQFSTQFKHNDGSPIINWDNMPLPSKLGGALIDSNVKPPLEAVLQQQADAAIKAGKDPSAVKQRIQEILQAQQNAQKPKQQQPERPVGTPQTAIPQGAEEE